MKILVAACKEMSHLLLHLTEEERESVIWTSSEEVMDYLLEQDDIGVLIIDSSITKKDYRCKVFPISCRGRYYNHNIPQIIRTSLRASSRKVATLR